jgi:DNA-binding NarL/FixJ family response regulator
MEWVFANKDWFLSGIGATILGLIYTFITNKKEVPIIQPQTNQSVIVTNNLSPLGSSQETNSLTTVMSLPDRKSKTKILFIDDDTKFKVVKILTNSGWIHTSIIKDAKTLDEPSIIDAHILFVDVQGVGVAMGFDSEGLGLALALKEKYHQKKIVIYSAETNGDRFHEALRKADSFLPKNADPYEFQKLVEELSSEIAI